MQCATELRGDNEERWRRPGHPGQEEPSPLVSPLHSLFLATSKSKEEAIVYMSFPNPTDVLEAPIHCLFPVTLLDKQNFAIPRDPQTYGGPTLEGYHHGDLA